VTLDSASRSVSEIMCVIDYVGHPQVLWSGPDLL
jgi:hypothetical protein